MYGHPRGATGLTLEDAAWSRNVPGLQRLLEYYETDEAEDDAWWVPVRCINGWEPDTVNPPEVRHHADGSIELRGRVIYGPLQRGEVLAAPLTKPQVSLPESFRTDEDVTTTAWDGTAMKLYANGDLWMGRDPGP